VAVRVEALHSTGRVEKKAREKNLGKGRSQGSMCPSALAARLLDVGLGTGPAVPRDENQEGENWKTYSNFKKASAHLLAGTTVGTGSAWEEKLERKRTGGGEWDWK